VDKFKRNNCSYLCHKPRKCVDFTITKIGYTIHKILLMSLALDVALEFTNLLVVECSFAIYLEEGSQIYT